MYQLSFRQGSHCVHVCAFHESFWGVSQPFAISVPGTHAGTEAVEKPVVLRRKMPRLVDAITWSNEDGCSLKCSCTSCLRVCLQYPSVQRPVLHAVKKKKTYKLTIVLCFLFKVMEDTLTST